ncbi:hypothetical protein U8527_08405 [Kordia algicida OT-1]|uniref:Uncharacterized protein n=1 Tax=Kordia algicida OT-1 TaxID=391587 RepID=A9E6H9_9FLAO|nr:hypothetical protein [Kordia algicida]EDP95036.1 hypothetical protein KAOT1_01834 [Kordia algicida OT-1]
MKTYKSIEETIAEVRKKDRRYNYIVLIFTLVMIAFIITVIVYDQNLKKQEVIIEDNATVIKMNEIELARYKTQQIENERLRRQDSIRTDSITRLVSTLNKELATIKKQLARSSGSSSDKKAVLTNINLAQDKINRITNNISDNTIVRYYKRRRDGNRIENLIQTMKNPSFRLNIKDVPNDNGRYAVNTVWYGSDVNKSELSVLVNSLKNSGVAIKNIKEFDNPRTSGWKSKAIEIGYEAVRPNKTQLTKSEQEILRVSNNNIKYNVRFYSYKPNERIKNQLTTLIKKENYSITVYPDWKEKYAFFSNEPTVFYYDKNIKDIAEKLASTLSDQVSGVTFNVKLGNGYGIKAAEKKNTFIIHYTE